MGSTHNVSSVQAASTQQLRLFLASSPRVLIAPKYCCKWAPHQLFKDSDLATCCQVSAFLHDLFNPGASTITGPEPSSVISPGLSQVQTLTSSHDLFMPSQPVKPEKLYPSPVKRPAWGKTLAPLDRCFCVLNLRKHCPENFVSKMLVST